MGFTPFVVSYQLSMLINLGVQIQKFGLGDLFHVDFVFFKAKNAPQHFALDRTQSAIDVVTNNVVKQSGQDANGRINIIGANIKDVLDTTKIEGRGGEDRATEIRENERKQRPIL